MTLTTFLMLLIMMANSATAIVLLQRIWPE